MPNVPLVQPPIIGPSPSPNVRANPGMFDAVAQAGQRVGQAIGEAGDLAFRVKQATDTAYVIGAQTKLEAAGQEFKAWTLQNPDTSTWKQEFDARAQSAREGALSGSSQLSPMAKLHLNTAVKSWSVRSGAELTQMQTQQNLRNAQGIVNEGVNLAIMGNDPVGAHAIIDTAVRQGVLYPNVGTAMTKRVTVGIATNLANADAMADPFTAKDRLEEKNEDGTYKNYSGLPQASRNTMLFRVNKLAAETRSDTMRSWQQSVADAVATGSPMPDEEGVRAEAQRQGISPKFVDNLFKLPKSFDEGGNAAARTAIVNYDPKKDLDFTKLSAIEHQISALSVPADVKTELMGKLRSQSNPKAEHTLKSEQAEVGLKSINDAFDTGLYGDFKKDENGADQVASSAESQRIRQQAELTRASNITDLQHFLEENPKATAVQVQEHVQGLHAKSAATAAHRQVFAPFLSGSPAPAADLQGQLDALLKKYKK